MVVNSMMEHPSARPPATLEETNGAEEISTAIAPQNAVNPISDTLVNNNIPTTASTAAAALLADSSGSLASRSWLYDSNPTTPSAHHNLLQSQPGLNQQPPVSPSSTPTAASSLSSLAASEAAAATAIDIDTYFRGSSGFFSPMQNSYPHGKIKFVF